MGSLVSQWLLATQAYPQCKQSPDRMHMCHKAHASPWEGDRILGPGLVGSFAFCSVTPSLPCSHSHFYRWWPFPSLEETWEVKRGTSPWLPPLTEAKQMAELQHRQKLFPLAKSISPTPHSRGSVQHLLWKAQQGQMGGVRTKPLFFLGGASNRILWPAPGWLQMKLAHPCHSAVLAALNLTRAMSK